jgi:hypothetical protein
MGALSTGPHVIKLGNRQRWEQSASRPGRFTPREGATGNYRIESWMGPRALQDAYEHRKCVVPVGNWNNCGSVSRSLVAILAKLSRLLLEFVCPSSTLTSLSRIHRFRDSSRDWHHIKVVDSFIANWHCWSSEKTTKQSPWKLQTFHICNSSAVHLSSHPVATVALFTKSISVTEILGHSCLDPYTLRQCFSECGPRTSACPRRVTRYWLLFVFMFDTYK